MRRANRARSEDHFSPQLDAFYLATARVLYAYRTHAIEQHTTHQRVGDDLQIGSLQCGTQIASCGTGAQPPPAGLLRPPDPTPGPCRQVIDVCSISAAELFGGLYRGLAQGGFVTAMRREKWAAFTVHCVFLALPILRFAEERQHVIP